MAEVTTVNIDELEQWIGREEVLTDQITLTPIRALAAVLGRRETAISERRCDFAMLELAYFLPLHRQSEIGSDGHPRRGGFLPPVPLPRRMWAGSALEFRRPLRVGETVTRTSRIVDVSSKEGRSGSLVFVKVRHEIADSSNNAAVVEARDAGGRSAAVPVFGSDTFARERIPTRAGAGHQQHLHAFRRKLRGHAVSGRPWQDSLSWESSRLTARWWTGLMFGWRSACWRDCRDAGRR